MNGLLKILLCFCVCLRSLSAAPVPSELKQALAKFQAEGTRGWAFTQRTTGDKKSMVERFDPGLPEFHRWTLLEKDGHPPTGDETRQYNELQTRRSRAETAPNVKDQIDEETCELVNDDGTRASWRFRLRATDPDDTSAPHMKVTFTLHRPSATIERVELASFESFRPVWFVEVKEARTIIHYHLPDQNRPTLLKEITVKFRGTYWWLRSVDQDMTVSYSDYQPPSAR